MLSGREQLERGQFIYLTNKSLNYCDIKFDFIVNIKLNIETVSNPRTNDSTEAQLKIGEYNTDDDKQQ